MLWVSRPDLIDEFAATLRTSSPAVDAAMVPGGSHPIGKSPAADAYNNEVMAFVAGLTY